MLREAFQHDLDNLFSRLLSIGSMVEVALKDALIALEEQDLELAAQVIQGDKELNAAVQSLHYEALLLITKQAPIARDLRLISMVLSTLPEFERMGDHAATVAKTAQRIARHTNPLPIRAMPEPFNTLIFELGQRVREMLHEGLVALDKRDHAFGERVSAMDDEVDHLYAQLFRATAECTREHPELIDEALHLLRLAHDLERIGDRVTNLAEQIIFLLTGDITELNT